MGHLLLNQESRVKVFNEALLEAGVFSLTLGSLIEGDVAFSQAVFYC
jgi:hypothetical protein